MHEGIFSSHGTLDSTATFSGLLQCQDDVFDIKTTVTTLGSIPIPDAMSIVDTINVHDSTTLTLPYHGQGTGSGEFSIHIEGQAQPTSTCNGLRDSTHAHTRLKMKKPFSHV